MGEVGRPGGLARREFVIGVGAAGAAGVLCGPPGAGAQELPSFDEGFKTVGGDKTPEEKGVRLELPEIAENGNTVPFSVAVDSPMTEQDHVRAIHVLSTGNPQPVVATFRFTPASGKASVSSRMRLAKTQEIVTVAELSTGKFVVGRKLVKVTIGGCGG